MIFVTVGTQLPFDRMIRAVDQWAGNRFARPDVIAQIGPTDFFPEYINAKPFVTVNEFAELAGSSRIIVSHAGIGSILTALRLGKPIVIMPRRAALGEHRNDHQLATAANFRNRSGVFVADDELELPNILDSIADLRGSIPIESFASPCLISAVREFIEFGKVTKPPLDGEVDDEMVVPNLAQHRQLAKNHSG